MFGDELPLDVPRTVGNALRRRASMGDLGDGVVTLDVEDFEVTETERRTSAAVALCVDLSFSMVQDGRWGPMKQTALALNHLIETRFRQDALQVIGFNRLARRLSPVQLAEAEPEYVQGTNLQHALLLASRHLRRHPDAEPVVLVVTDGEPTAHLTGDGDAFFRWPSTHETVRATDGAGRRAGPLRGDDQHLHAGRRRGAAALRRRDRPAGRRTGVHPRHRPAGRVRGGRLPDGAARPALNPDGLSPPG